MACLPSDLYLLLLHSVYPVSLNHALSVSSHHPAGEGLPGVTPTGQVILAWGLGLGWRGTGLEVARGPGQGSVTRNASQELMDVYLREKGEMRVACPQNGAVHTHLCDPQRKRFLP